MRQRNRITNLEQRVAGYRKPARPAIVVYQVDAKTYRDPDGRIYAAGEIRRRQNEYVDGPRDLIIRPYEMTGLPL